MKILRITLAVILSLAMLYIARQNSRGQPEEVRVTNGTFTLAMTTVPKITEYQSDTIRATITPINDPSTLVLICVSTDPESPRDRYECQPMHTVAVENGTVTVAAETTVGAKNSRNYYFFRVVTPSGESVLVDVEGQPFSVRSIGEVPAPVLITHVFFIFATVFCVAMAFMHAWPVIMRETEVRPMVRWLGWAALLCFIGGYPAGIPMNWYAFGGTWEGVPFGTDATDNKTQLLFIYLLFSTLSALGTLTGGRLGRDLFGHRTLGVIGIGSLAVMLFIYLIPHSIQFSAALTYAFCYGWIGLLAVLYVVGLVRSRGSRQTVTP